MSKVRVGVCSHFLPGMQTYQVCPLMVFRALIIPAHEEHLYSALREGTLKLGRSCIMDAGSDRNSTFNPRRRQCGKVRVHSVLHFLFSRIHAGGSSKLVPQARPTDRIPTQERSRRRAVCDLSFCPSLLHPSRSEGRRRSTARRWFPPTPCAAKSSSCTKLPVRPVQGRLRSVFPSSQLSSSHRCRRACSHAPSSCGSGWVAFSP